MKFVGPINFTNRHRDSRNGLALNCWGGITCVTRPQRVNMCMWFCILGQVEGCQITCVEMSCCCPLGKIFQSERAYSSYASLSHTSRLQYIPSNIIMVWVCLYIINLSRSLWFLHPYLSGLLRWHCTETKMSSFWRNFHHWLHWKLSFWQLPVQPVMIISSKWRHFRFCVGAVIWLSQCQCSNKYRLKRKEKDKSREEIFYQMKVFFVKISCKFL